MQNVMVASSKRHAAAMIVWMKLKPEEWTPIAYGDPVTKCYSHAKLVRPGEGVEQAHSDWVFEKLVPNLYMTCSTVPPNWRVPQEHIS